MLNAAVIVPVFLDDFGVECRTKKIYQKISVLNRKIGCDCLENCIGHAIVSYFFLRSLLCANWQMERKSAMFLAAVTKAC